MSGYIYAPAKHRRSGSAMQKSKARGSASKYEAAREVLPGYPVDRIFTCAAEIEDYLNHEKVACLLCGKAYNQLSPHVKRIHGMDADDYRQKYGIPKAYGLLGTERLRAAKEAGHSARNMERMANMWTLRGGATPHRKPFVPMTKRAMAARVNDPSINRRRYEDFAWHLEAMRTVWKFGAITPPPGQASWSGFKKRWLHDPELKLAVKSSRAEFRANVKRRIPKPTLVGNGISAETRQALADIDENTRLAAALAPTLLCD